MQQWLTRIGNWLPRPSWDAVLLFAVLFMFGLIALVPSIHGHDGILNYVYLRSWYFDGDLDFRNDYRQYDRLTDNAFELRHKPVHPETELPLNYYGVGSAILWAPLYIAGQSIRDWWTERDDEDNGNEEDEKDEDIEILQYEGDDRFSSWLIGLGTLLWGTWGLTLLYSWGRREWGVWPALVSLGLIYIASPLPFYIYFHPSMSHANSFFAVSLLYYLYFSKKPPWSQVRWIGIGISAALVVMTRYQDAFLLVAPLAGEIMRLFSRDDNRPLEPFWKQRMPNYLAAAVAFLIAFLPQNLAWAALHLSLFSGPTHYLSIDSLDLTRPVHFLQIFFSSRHGLFFWHPLLLLGLIGLFLKFQGKSLYRSPLLLALFMHAYVIACWEYWYAGASFGQRMFISTLPLFYLGALNLISRTTSWTRWKIWHILVLVVFGLWNAGLMVQYGANMIPREEKVSISRIFHNQFVKVPKFVWTKGASVLLKKEVNDEG